MPFTIKLRIHTNRFIINILCGNKAKKNILRSLQLYLSD